MFEKMMQAAERTANGVSRRDFLGRLGQGAAVVAAAAAGMMAAAAHGAPQVFVCDATSLNGCGNQPKGTACVYYEGRRMYYGTCQPVFRKGTTQCYCSAVREKGGR